MTKRTISAVALVMVLGGGAARAACLGDCGSNEMVTVNELILGVNIALELRPITQCMAMDGNSDNRVTVNELVAAVANALNGCPYTGAYSSRVDVGDGQTATIRFEVDGDGQATGSLSVGTAAGLRGALQLQIPLVNLSGTVDLDTGEYHLTGSVDGADGPVPIDVSGTLPERLGNLGTLQLDIGSESFTGSVVSGSGLPTPTETQAEETPTPTATTIPQDFPTPPQSCLEGSLVGVATNLDGTNSYRDLAPVAVGKLGARLRNMEFLHTFGGQAVPCTANIGDIIVNLQFAAFDSTDIVVGKAYPLGDGSSLSYASYLELPATNPLGARGWKAHGGFLIIDSIDGDSAQFRIVDAQMVAEPSFSLQTPATGTFTLNARGTATNIFAQ